MPSVLVVDSDREVVRAFRSGFTEAEARVLSSHSGEEAVEIVARHRPDVVVMDTALPDGSGLEIFRRIRLRDPGIPVIFMTASGTASTAIDAIACGAFDYVVKPLELAKIRELVAQACKVRHDLPVAAGPAAGGDALVRDDLVGRCLAMKEVYKANGRVASQKVNVLILGESGTGKELVAHAIQQHSPRAGAQFLAVNCAAIPEPLLESELFGHEKGAFTGADSKRVGKFEQCSGGTLFLDEVGDMTPLMQSKVLRVLQEGRFERVGGNATIETDVRIIAATNRDLDAMVANGHFRADLYYRLNVFSIQVPPLRDRAVDLPLLVDHFLDVFCRELGKPLCKVSPEAMGLLAHYPWPGNVRELQSVLKRAVLQASLPVLFPDDLPADLKSKPCCAVDFESYVNGRLHAGSTALHAEALDYMERVVLTRVLRHTAGNQSRAAHILNITRGTLRNRIRQLGINIHQAVNVEAG